MRMWPFENKPDTRPATASAMAIAASLRTEPQRWSILGDDHLQHDSGIVIGTAGFTWRPNLDDEPDANGDVIVNAIDDWVAAQMKLPPKPQETPATAASP